MSQPFRQLFDELVGAEGHALALPVNPPAGPQRRPPEHATSGEFPAGDWLLANGYEILHPLRDGGMGRVYKARHVALGKVVCLKTLRPDIGSAAEKVTLSARFREEARAAGRLNHPHLVRVLDFGQDAAGTLYLAMEFIDGRDLDQVLRDEFPLGEERLCELGAQISEALAHAHDRGIVHRDLKPSNILLDGRTGDPDRIKVIDFGIAKVAGAPKLTQTGFVSGTAQYMSPEQASGDGVDGRTDLYSLGVVLYELATRTLPFPGDNPSAVMYAQVHTPPQPPRVRRPEVALSDELEALVLRLLAKDPDDRPGSAQELAQELRALQRRARARREARARAAEDTRRRQEADRLQHRLAQLAAEEETARSADSLPERSVSPSAWWAQRVEVRVLLVACAVSLLIGLALGLTASVFLDTDGTMSLTASSGASTGRG